MAKKESPLRVELPRPADDTPAWSRVGIIAAAGFVVGIAWPRLAGVKIGPSAPDDERTQAAAVAAASASAAAAAAAPAMSPSASAAAIAAPAAPPGAPAANQQLVVIGPGKITRCWDKKSKKVDDCEKLQFDPIALPKLKELAACPSALGLEGKMTIGFDIDFSKKEVHVLKAKKGTSLPASTVTGILQCAAREFSNVALEDVPHKFRRYSLAYVATFYPPGKHPTGDAEAAKGGGEGEGGEDGEAAAGSTTSETEASGLAVVNWDTALVRKEPKDGDVVTRLVRGTKVKLVGRQNDWYKVEHGSKTGWVHRAAIGL